MRPKLQFYQNKRVKIALETLFSLEKYINTIHLT